MPETDFSPALRQLIDAAALKFVQFATPYLATSHPNSSSLDKTWLNPEKISWCSTDWDFATHNYYYHSVGHVMAAIVTKADMDYQRFTEAAKGTVDLYLYNLALDALYITEGADVVEPMQEALDTWDTEDFIQDVLTDYEVLDQSYGDQCWHFVQVSQLGTETGWKELCQKYSYLADKAADPDRDIFALHEEDRITEVMAIPELAAKIESYCREQIEHLIIEITPENH